MVSMYINVDEEKLKYYIFGFVFIFILGLLFFIFHRKFRVKITDYIKNHKFFLIAFGSFYALYAVVRLFLYDEYWVMLYDEDGVFEYLTAIFFLLAAILFLLTFLNVRKVTTNWNKLFLLALVFCCFLVGMEEISWGQRLLGIETPESIKALNHQGETTIHNLVHERFYYEIYSVFTFCCVVFFGFTNTTYKSLFGVPQSYLPSKKFLVIALLLIFLLFFNMEHYEVILSCMFFVYSYQLYRRKTINSTAQKTSG